ncbi:SCO family protein [bacterium]|nr:SCO family protein [bacterium]
MKNKTGPIILIALLAIPVIWIFLWKKTEFGYEPLPIYTEVIFGDTVPLTIDTFTLYDQYGNTFTRDSIGDRIFVANFFFANCPDVCPQMNSNLKLVTEKFKDNPGVVFLSHTVDPENDTIEALAEYASDFGAENNSWHFLTGKKRTIYDLASKSYRLVSVQKDTNTFIHSEKIILVDKQFRIRGYYEGRDFKDIQKLEDDIPFLLKLYKDGAENKR